METILNQSVSLGLKPDSAHFYTPSPASFDYPEKILQFGTGVLLRGLIDYFVDKGNKTGHYAGRIAVVKSTGGSASDFDRQQGVYTHLVKGIEQGQLVEETWINNSIARVLPAQSAWQTILEVAASPALEIVVSNTTEVGIQYVEEHVLGTHAPESFPGKLLAALYHRYSILGGTEATGLVIIPTELIVDNGKKLKQIVLDLARFNQFNENFIHWVESHNHFCNSLVDRIVPGKPAPEVVNQNQQTLGYQDDLLIMSEAYRLWAIEGGPVVKSKLGFANADHGVVVAEDITPYRERKLRLLNGVHTISVAYAYLNGLDNVQQMMEDAETGPFVEQVAHQEFVPSVRVDRGSAVQFAHEVLDRFRNPHIVHPLINITLQYTSKMAMRNVQILKNYLEDNGQVPARFTKGFAAYLAFSKPAKVEAGKYYGLRNGQYYPINDDKAAILAKHWERPDVEQVVQHILAETSLWGEDLNALNGFTNAVVEALKAILA